MAVRSSQGDGQQVGGDEPRGHWRRRLHSRLSLLACDPQGSGGSADLRAPGPDTGARPPVRSDDGGSADAADTGGQNPGHAGDRDGGGLRDGGERDGGNGAGGTPVRVSSFETLELAELPDVQDRHRLPARRTAADDTEDGLRDEPALFDGSAVLTGLTERALERLQFLLDLMPDPTGEHYPSELRTLLGAINATLATQVKVDENALRRRAVDMLPQILKTISAIEQKLPPSPIVGSNSVSINHLEQSA